MFFHLYLAISGYEMYTTMRADPCLCFVEQCGRPNEQDINAEQQAADPELGEGSVSNRPWLCFSKASCVKLITEIIGDNGFYNLLRFTMLFGNRSPDL